MKKKYCDKRYIAHLLGNISMAFRILFWKAYRKKGDKKWK